MTKRTVQDQDGKWVEPITTTDIHPDMKKFLMPDRVFAARCPYCFCHLHAFGGTGTSFSCDCSKNLTIYKRVFYQGSADEELELSRPIGMLSINHMLSKDLKTNTVVNYYEHTSIVTFTNAAGLQTHIPRLEIPKVIPVESELAFRKKMNLYVKLS